MVEGGVDTADVACGPQIGLPLGGMLKDAEAMASGLSIRCYGTILGEQGESDGW